MPRQGLVCRAGQCWGELECWTVLCSPHPGSAISMAFLFVIAQRPLSINKNSCSVTNSALSVCKDLCKQLEVMSHKVPI